MMGGINEEFGVNYINCYMERDKTMSPYLYSTGKYIHYLIIKYGRKKYEKEYICNVYIYVCVCHFAVYQKATQCNVDYNSISSV